MNIRSLDLNLLVVLDALLEECHVSRAAERVGLSQPATSHALQRCRQLLKDPLLERGPRGMQPTPRALQLRQPLQQALRQLEELVQLPPPELAQLQQTVSLIMADALSDKLLPALVTDLHRNAPKLQLCVLPWRGGERAFEDLSRSSVDLVLSVLPELGPEFHRQPALTQEYRVVMRDGHPALDNFHLESWLAYPHLLVSGRGEKHGPLDQVLAQKGLSRKIGLIVAGFSAVPELLRRTDLIAMLPENLAQAPGLLQLAPPLPLPGFCIDLVWHQRRHHDRGVRYVSQRILEILQRESMRKA